MTKQEKAKKSRRDDRQNNHQVKSGDFRKLQESFVGDSETAEALYC